MNQTKKSPIAMAGKPDRHRRNDTLAALALIVLPVACCGLPVLIAAGALGGVGTLLHIPWLLTTAAALLVGGAVWLRHRRTSSKATAAHRAVIRYPGRLRDRRSKFITTSSTPAVPPSAPGAPSTRSSSCHCSISRRLG
jgi:hypothetical protein